MHRKPSYPGSAKVEGIKKDIDRNWEAQRRDEATYKAFDHANYERYAADHVLGRNSCIVRALCFFNLMRAAGLSDGKDLTLKAAHVQHFSGDRANRTNAAHCMPGQILAGNRRPWDLKWFTDHPAAGEQFSIAFGQVTYLPRSFNVADTAHERVPGGTGHALLHACIAAASAQPLPRSAGNFRVEMSLVTVQDACRIDRQLVRDTYDHWLDGAKAGYDRAAQAVKEGKYVEKGIEAAELLEILGLYQKFNKVVEPQDLSDRNMDRIERDFNIKPAKGGGK